MCMMMGSIFLSLTENHAFSVLFFVSIPWEKDCGKMVEREERGRMKREKPWAESMAVTFSALIYCFRIPRLIYTSMLLFFVKVYQTPFYIFFSFKFLDHSSISLVCLL